MRVHITFSDSHFTAMRQCNIQLSNFRNYWPHFISMPNQNIVIQNIYLQKMTTGQKYEQHTVLLYIK
uniref:Uncharacterized protein n=1 Tax=Anguilla anguilla TaxID=7936 RepID=A0A0E9TNF9_ANGAN